MTEVDFQYKIIDPRYIFLYLAQRPMQVAQRCEHTKNCLIVHFKMVNIMVCEFCLNQKKTLKDCKALLIVGL